MDYFNSDVEPKRVNHQNEIREVQVDTSKSKPSKSVDVKAIKEEVLRSNNEVQEEDIIISAISDDEENLQSLNLDKMVEREESLKSEISNATVEKETIMEESVESSVKDVEISNFVLSCVSVRNPSNIYVSTCRPSLLECTSSDDPNPEESPKSNIADNELLLDVKVLSISYERASETAAPNLEETGLHIHKKKLLHLHRELKQFHSIRKTTPEDSSGNETSGVSRPNKASHPINKPITKSSTNTQLPNASNESRDSSELKESETELSSIAHLRIPFQQIEHLRQTVAPLLSTLCSFCRHLEPSRNVERISSASLVRPSVRRESNKLTRGRDVINLVPIFEHLLEDLLVIKGFVNATSLSLCNPCDDPSDYEPALNERLLASITKDVGTGVESTAAQYTRSLPSDLMPTRLVAAAAGTKGELRSEATAERGYEFLGKFGTEQKTVAASVESEPSVSSDSTSLQESIDLQSTPALDPRLEAETNPCDISRQLLRLNRVARHQLCSLISVTIDVLDYCVEHAPHLFLSRFDTRVDEILDDLEYLLSLRQECSTLLSECHIREDSDLIYILKVKTRIVAVYNTFLQCLFNLKFEVKSLLKRR